MMGNYLNQPSMIKNKNKELEHRPGIGSLCNKKIHPKDDIYCYYHAIIKSHKLKYIYDKKKQKVAEKIFIKRTNRIKDILSIQT